MDNHVIIPPANIKGELCILSSKSRTIIFVHGSGSNRFSSRNDLFQNISANMDLQLY